MQIRRRAPEATVDPQHNSVKLAQLVSQVIEGLTDDLKVAMDMEEKQLSARDAIDTLVSLMDGHVSQCKHDEARGFYKIGSKTIGPFTRQPGEPMRSYTERR